MRTTTRLGMTNITNSRICSSKKKIFESTKDEKFEISISAPKDEKLERWLTRPAKKRWREISRECAMHENSSPRTPF